MFALIESCPEQREGMGWTGKVVSLMTHAFLISIAVAMTRHIAADPAPPPIIGRDLVWDVPAPVHLEGGVSGSPVTTASAPWVPLVAPVEVPNQVLPPDPGSQAWQPPGTEFQPGPISVVSSSTIPIGPAPVDARIVEEQPQLLSHPALRYPEVLRQAGIEGRVLVEAVLDSLGRPESGSLRVVSSAHPLFDPEALGVVQGSRYRPGRIAGRAVRVRVQVPVTFEIRR